MTKIFSLAMFFIMAAFIAYSYAQADLPPPLPEFPLPPPSQQDAQNLSCMPYMQIAAPGARSSLFANGAGGSYVWSAIGGAPSTDSGWIFNVSYSTTGLKRIVVTSEGQSMVCIINVTSNEDENFAVSVQTPVDDMPPPLPDILFQATNQQVLYDVFDKLDALKASFDGFSAKADSASEFYRRTGRGVDAVRLESAARLFRSVSTNIDETKSFILANRDSSSEVSQAVKRLTSYTRGVMDDTESLLKPQKPPEKTCRPTGCNGELCSDHDVQTTCVYRDEYACYKSASCEKMSDGNCGWTMTSSLNLCLDSAATKTTFTVYEGKTARIGVVGSEHLVTLDLIIDTKKVIMTVDGKGISIETDEPTLIGSISITLDAVRITAASKSATITVTKASGE